MEGKEAAKRMFDEESAALLFLLLFLASSEHHPQSHGQTDYQKLHFDAIVADTHNDVVQRILNGEDIGKRTTIGHSDIPRFIEGGLDIQVFSIWVPPEKKQKSYYDQANEQIDSIYNLTARNLPSMGVARNETEIRNLLAEKKFVAILGMEGGHPLDDDLVKLNHFYNRGVRYITLTWNNSTSWASSAYDETVQPEKLKQRGLTKLGEKIVRRMNELGIMVDVSHIGEASFWDVVKTTTKPIIASHSSVWKLCHHRRNLKDDQMKAIAKTGGVVFINFLPNFIDSTFLKKEQNLRELHKGRIDSLRKTWKGDWFSLEYKIADMLKEEYKAIRPPLKVLIDHFDYALKLIGTDHVGIGSDFDGIHTTPLDMDDVTFLPNITRELLKRGYSEEDIQKVLGGNFLRVVREVCR
jgi:membrane dipeptidase